MLKWKRDAILSVVLMIACAAGILYSNTMTSDMIKLRAAQPDVYLKLWLGIMLVLSAMLLVKTLRERSEEVVEKLWGPLQIFTVVSFIVYLLILPFAGFRVSTLIFMMSVTSVYNLYCLEERPAPAVLAKKLAIFLLFAIITTLATEFVFRNLLAVRLPVWKLF